MSKSKNTKVLIKSWNVLVDDIAELHERLLQFVEDPLIEHSNLADELDEFIEEYDNLVDNYVPSITEQVSEVEEICS